jgi:hypothetical protein
MGTIRKKEKFITKSTKQEEEKWNSLHYPQNPEEI